MPEGELCHGDFHPLNIIGPIGQEVLVDWLDATRGDPAAYVCRSFVLMRHWAPEVAGAYVEAYAGGSGETPGEDLQVASVRCRRPARGGCAGRGRRIDGDGQFPLEPVRDRAVAPDGTPSSARRVVVARLPPRRVLGFALWLQLASLFRPA